jgi:hypothetical protein
MTADEIIVGIDDSARAALRWAAAYPDRPKQRFAPFMWSTSARHMDMYVYPVVADYVYPDGSGWSVVVRQ